MIVDLVVNQKTSDYWISRQRPITWTGYSWFLMVLFPGGMLLHRVKKCVLTHVRSSWGLSLPWHAAIQSALFSIRRRALAYGVVLLLERADQRMRASGDFVDLVISFVTYSTESIPHFGKCHEAADPDPECLLIPPRKTTPYSLETTATDRHKSSRPYCLASDAT